MEDVNSVVTRNHLMKSFSKRNSVIINHKDNQPLAIEMFKVKQKLCPEITSETFMERTNNQYNLQNRLDFIAFHVISVYHRRENTTYLGPKIWNIVPEQLKQKSSLNCFKNLSKCG